MELGDGEREGVDEMKKGRKIIPRRRNSMFQWPLEEERMVNGKYAEQKSHHS